MKIQQRLRALRAQYDEELQEIAARAEIDAKQNRTYLENEAQQVVTSMYTNLWRKTLMSVGVSDVTDFCAEGYVFWDNNKPKYVETVRRQVRSLCGIDVWIDPNRKERYLAKAALDTALAKTYYVFRRDLAKKLNRSGATVKAAPTCRVVWHNSGDTESDTDEPRKHTGELVYSRPLQHNSVIHKLDFPALVQENRRRDHLWYEQLDEIAKHLIDECRASLELVPDKCYGLDTDLELKDVDGGSLLDKFKFGTQQLEYRHLSDSRRNELLAYMNSIIRGGEIRFVSDAYGYWRVHIRRCVPAYGTAQPYFDYGEYCAQYETWASPELADDFAHLTNGLALTSAFEQVLTLQPERELHYFFDFGNRDELSYSLLYRSLERDPPVSGVGIAEKFLETVRATLPGIRVKDASCVSIGDVRVCIDCQRNRWAIRTALSVRFEMAEIEQCCDLLREQHRIEQTIARIRKRKIQYLATKVIEMVLKRVESHDISLCFDENSQTPRMFTIYTDSLRIRLNGDLDCYCVDLSEVKDNVFLAKIDKAVWKKTNGFITTNLRDRWFTVNPQVAIAPTASNSAT